MDVLVKKIETILHYFANIQMKTRQNIGQRKHNICMKGDLLKVIKNSVKPATSGSQRISL